MVVTAGFIKLFLVTLLAISCIPSVFSKKLETVNDNEFLKLIQTEKFVVVLFTKPSCKACEDAEHELSMAREGLVDALGAWVVKAVSSPFAKLYSPTLEPAIVFFRGGIPLLYHGPVAEDDVLSILQRSQDPAVKELNDDTFEHLTQASTGATTGDWLVMFTQQSCVKSQRLQSTWEAVGSALKSRINVARVDRTTSGVTARRFEVSETPAFILFRHGKMYKYELDAYSVPNFVDFATDFYRNSKAQSIPVPKSPFDDFCEMVVEKMKENPQVVKLISIVTTVLVLLGILITFRGKAEEKKVEKKRT